MKILLASYNKNSRMFCAHALQVGYTPADLRTVVLQMYIAFCRAELMVMPNVDVDVGNHNAVNQVQIIIVGTCWSAQGIMLDMCWL
jgi:hypothetical protein